MTDQDPITLKDASAHFGFTLSALKAEAARGRLTIYKISRRLYTTPADIRDMVNRCRVEPKVPAFTLIQGEGNGLSETDHALSALAAANETATRLKSSSRTISAANTSRNRQVRR